MVNWKEIHLDFTPELQKEWIDKGFSYGQCKEWIDIGLKVNEVDYACWLRDIQKVDAEWVLNCDDNDDLRRAYRKGEHEISQTQQWLDDNYPKEIRSKKLKMTIIAFISQKGRVGKSTLSQT